MDRQHILDRIKQAKIHTWSKTMAARDELFVEGRIENFEKFVELIVQDAVTVIAESMDLENFEDMNDWVLGYNQGLISAVERVHEYFGLDNQS